MAVKGNKTAGYSIVKKAYGNIYRFFCDASGALICETRPYKRADAMEELSVAWELEGKEHFNRCRKCGRWVADVMYNPDVFNCVRCSPIEDIPDYCPKCGEKVDGAEVFCKKCGVRLLYGGETDEEH